MMIRATLKGGRLEADVPADWPDGTEVEIYPVPSGTPDDAGRMCAEEIPQTLATMDLVEPLDITDAERAAWEAEREDRIQDEKARFAVHAESLRRIWEHHGSSWTPTWRAITSTGVFDRARVEAADGNPIGIGIPVLAELVAGIEHSRSRDRNMKRLQTALASLRLWPFDSSAAFEYRRIYAELALRG